METSENSPLLVGICGLKGSGKTTLANGLADKTGGKVMNFADPLKEMAIEYFGLDRSTVFGTQDDKDGTLTAYHKSELPSYSGEDKDGYAIYREFLQYLGTDIFRTINPECWVNKLKAEAGKSGKPVFVGDVRFPNEVEACNRAVGVDNGSSSDGHASEQRLDVHYIDTAEHGIEETVEIAIGILQL